MKKHYEIDLRRNVMEFDKERKELKLGWLYGIHESGIPIINLINRGVLDRGATIKLVVEYNTEILDEIEKRYLENVLRPFKNRDVVITKNSTYDNGRKEYLHIGMDNYNTEILLPNFKANTMYKGMELDIDYTLQELKLFQKRVDK